MKRYMLDTNTVSFLLREHPAVMSRVLQVPMAELCISAITEGEMLFGLAKRPEATRLKRAVSEFLLRVEVSAWDSIAAAAYGSTRAELERRGKILAPLDMLIASHALSLKLVLVTNDGSFAHMEGLELEDWTQKA
jgi:tRNA(fMet)-specific endonuclease VapC